MRNGCHNRPAFRAAMPMQDGWRLDGPTRTPRLVSVPFRMKRECGYTSSDLGRIDPGCLGCRWRESLADDQQMEEKK